MKLHGVCLFVVLAVANRPALAQTPESGVVTGTGVVTISRAPETMRVQIALLAKGTTLKDALATLKARTESARSQLVALGAGKDTIRVEPARITTIQNDSQRQIEMMMRSRRGGKPSAKTKVAPPVTVSATLTAEFKLEGGADDELLLAVYPLQEKIRAADLAGAKEAEKLTPEQEELLEEAEGVGYNRYGGEEQKPGEPVFLFVSRVSDEEREKALTEAFQKAKTQAGKVARAAGTELGVLRSLTGADYPGADGDDYFGAARYDSTAYRAVQLARAQQGAKDDVKEAIATEPGLVKYNVTVNASFDLKPPK